MKISLRLKLIALLFSAVLIPLFAINFLNINSPISYLFGFLTTIAATLVLFLILKPLDKFVQAAKSLGEGNLNYKLDIRSNDELESVADAFNLMAGKLAFSFQKLEQEKDVISSEKNRIDSVLSSIVDGIIALDFNKNIVFTNKTAESITGFTLNDLKGKPIDQFIHLYSDQEEITPKIYCDVSFNQTVTLIGRDGKRAKVNLITSKIDGQVQTNLGCILMLHDLSREEDLERMKLDFISMASHELKTPLTSIIGYLSVFIQENRGKIATDELNLLEKSLISSQQLLSLVQNILSVNKIERDQLAVSPQIVDYQAILTKSVEDLQNQAKQKNITLTLNLPNESLPKVMADPIRITEVVTNLVANSINYTNAGGKVDISVQISQVEVTTSISDTGIGIPKEAIPHLFNKFFRVSNTTQQASKGTGLGLYIAKSIINRLGGKIWVESEIGLGSKFYFTLPVTSGIKTFESDQFIGQEIQHGALNY